MWRSSLLPIACDLLKSSLLFILQSITLAAFGYGEVSTLKAQEMEQQEAAEFARSYGTFDAQFRQV